MRKLYFNFNNEVDRFEIEQDEETGKVIVPGENGPLAEYASLKQFAELYAQARDVKPEHLKNWMLTENGDVVSFILRAGTAGISMANIRGPLSEVLDNLAADGSFHPVDIQRVRQELLGQGDGRDAMEVLASCTNAEIARAVYDRLDEQGAFAEPKPEPVDERSELEKYLDSVLERDGMLAFFSNMLAPGNTNGDKEEIMRLVEESSIPYTVPMLADTYENALRNAREEGINVDTRFKALLVTTQEIPCTIKESAKNKLIVAANMAKRTSINIARYTVGHKHIRTETVLVTPLELEGLDVSMDDNIPVVVVFDRTVDEELEEERRRAQEEEASQTPVPYTPEDEDEEDDDEEEYDY